MKVTFNGVKFRITVNYVAANNYYVNAPIFSADALDCALMSLKTGPALLDSELCVAIDEAREHVERLFSELVQWTERNECCESIALAAFGHIVDGIDTCCFPDDIFTPIADALEAGSRVDMTVKSKLFTASLHVADCVLYVTVTVAGERFDFTRDYSC